MIALDGVSVRQGAFALDGVRLAVPAGAYAVLLGRTGSGKTTLLEVIAGLRRPAAGRVLLRGKDVTALPPAARAVGYVPQDAALFRTMTVRDNLAFALSVRGAARREIDVRVAELADRLGLAGLLGRRAVGLSGGEAQRVALGRALAFRPDILLLDEPLNAVDEATRADLVAFLDAIRREHRMTVLHVTHTRPEADRLADVVLELDAGRVAARPLPRLPPPGG
jgi:ABC-type sugar transport system ATPase subunit